MTLLAKYSKIKKTMFKTKMTIWIMGLILISPVGGFSKVICYGPDGHIAIEPVVHNHCECPETDSQYRLAGSFADASSDHDHCTDKLAISGVILSIRKNIKRSSKLVVAMLTSKTPLLDCHSILSCFSVLRCEFSSFHEPLRTVILLS